jgi:putative nucleotidyltransferase with HDIG domain
VSIVPDLSKAIEAREPCSAGHAARVAVLAEVVAARLGWDEVQIEVLRLGAVLHDIGKLVVSERILRKQGPLSEEELVQVREHPEAGARMVELVRTLRPAASCVRHHHERWDGCGYPTGCAGEEIPAEARVLAVVDAFDAMTSDRPYRRALPALRAIAELERCAGSQFDPEIVNIFVRAWADGALSMPGGALQAAAV